MTIAKYDNRQARQSLNKTIT